MLKYSSYIIYPLFRLTLSMAAGIFLFDKFLSDCLSWRWAFGMFGASVLLTCCSLFSSAYRWRSLFGYLATLSFFLFGGCSVLYQHSCIDYPWPRKPEIYEGVVQTVPFLKGKTFRAEVEVTHQLEIPDDGMGQSGELVPVSRKIMLYWIPDSAGVSVCCGDRICFYASVSRPVSDVTLTGFDYGNYLFRQGISGTALAFEGAWKRLEPGRSLTLKQRALLVREHLLEQYRNWGLEGDILAVVSALTVGEKRGLTDELKAVYSAAGTSHVLALSGLHVGMIAGILWILLSPLKRWRYGKTVASCLLVVCLWMFAFLSGLSASVVRAVTMFTLYALASWILEERFSGFLSVTLTAFLMLVYQPMYLFDISFQLSFVAVYGILLFFPLISSWLNCRNRVVGYLWNVLSVSLSAQIATLPLILYYFGAFPTYFLLANLVVTPLACCILGATLGAFVLGSLPVVGTSVVWLLMQATIWLNTIMESVSSLAGSQLTAIHLSAFQSFLLFLLFGAVYAYLHHRSAFRLMACLGTACAFLAVGIWLYARPFTDSFYLYRSDVYHRKRFEAEVLSSAHGFYRLDSLQVAVLKDSCWRKKQAGERLRLDYAYICRGFRGNMAGLLRVFEIRQVVFDGSLSPSYRDYLRAECVQNQIPFTELPSEGSYRIIRQY